MAAWDENAAPAAREKDAAAARLEAARGAWDDAIALIDETRKKQMQAPGLQEPAKKALATLDRECDGLIAHRDYPMVGLDNNRAERQIRGPVVTRKNTGGSRNGDSARSASAIWTVTATAQMAGLNIITYLAAYLNECGRNAGKPLPGPACPTPARGSPGSASGPCPAAQCSLAGDTRRTVTAPLPPERYRADPAGSSPGSGSGPGTQAS